jgi:hypothetical protein
MDNFIPPELSIFKSPVTPKAHLYIITWFWRKAALFFSYLQVFPPIRQIFIAGEMTKK